MGLLHSIVYSGSPLDSIPLGTLDPGATKYHGAFSVTLDGTIAAAAFEVGAALKNSQTSGTDAEGDELSDETWVQVSPINPFHPDYGTWFPIGGGAAGTTYAITIAGVYLIRTVVPAEVSTWGDIEAVLEFYYRLTEA